MYRSIASIVALTMLMVSTLHAQRIASYRSGVTAAPRDTTPRMPNFFSAPSSERFGVSAEYIAMTAALGAAAGAVSFSDKSCSGCALWGATMGSYVGTGVGNRLAADALRCDRWDASVRTGLASFLVTSTALIIGHSDGRSGEWTAIVGVPLASAYFVAGCQPR